MSDGGDELIEGSLASGNGFEEGEQELLGGKRLAGALDET
jgi:hypothetical protein